MDPGIEMFAMQATPCIDLMLETIRMGRNRLGDRTPVGEELFRAKARTLSTYCDEVNANVLNSTLLRGGSGAWYDGFVPAYQAITQTVYLLSENLLSAADVIATYVAKLECWRTAMTERIGELEEKRQALLHSVRFGGLVEVHTQDVSITADAARKYDTLTSIIYNEETELSKCLNILCCQLEDLRKATMRILYGSGFSSLNYNETRSISVMSINQLKNASKALDLFGLKLYSLKFSPNYFSVVDMIFNRPFITQVIASYPKFVENGFRREVEAYVECHDRLLNELGCSATRQADNLLRAANSYENMDAVMADSLRTVLQE